MRLWGYRSKGWTAQHAFPVSNLNQVGQVGGARRELTYLQRTLTQPLNMAAQVLFYPGKIKGLSRADGNGILCTHRVSSTLLESSLPAAVRIHLYWSRVVQPWTAQLDTKS